MVAQTDQPFREWLGGLTENLYLEVLTEAGINGYQPRTGCYVCAFSTKVGPKRFLQFLTTD